ncbi:leucine-rich repeat transmembrane protein CCDC168 isoform X1 [Monodelphis domestica]|uniref:leucine-rich repeat transmembrane protein CCDC168 isoform X1 n=1 Tax=Monodelphis domestica TaxID=13616 RepID=UPI0024E1DC4F|nr:leucine-rich repeat transmembrane protein CCDC168 isoform X1 [Monodelphis domestica]
MDEETVAVLWENLESWISDYDWKSAFIMTFLVIAFELFLLELCRTCQKKIAEKNIQKESSSNSLKEEDTFLKNLGYENWPRAPLPPKKGPGALSRSQLLSSVDPQHPEGTFNEIFSTSYEWSGTSDNESPVSWSSGNGSQTSFSSEEISSSSFVDIVHKKPRPNYKRFSCCMLETPSYLKKSLPMKKKYPSKNKNVQFSSDHNLWKKPRITLENDWTPCPLAHLYLPKNQIKLLEENLRNQIPSKSQPVIMIKTTYQGSKFTKLNQASFSSEETSSKRQKMPQELSYHQGDIKPKGFFFPQDSVQSAVLIRSEVPGWVQSCNLTQDNFNIQTSEKARGLSYQKGQLKYPSQIRCKNGIYLTNLKSIMGPRVLSLKAKKPSVSQLLNISGSNTSTSRRKLGWNITRSNSAGKMNLRDVISASSQEAVQIFVPSSSPGRGRERKNMVIRRVTEVKFPQVQSKKSPEKTYAQPGEFKMKESTVSYSLSSEFSDIKVQENKDGDMIRAGSLGNRENRCPPNANKIRFLTPEQSIQQSKNMCQDVLNSFSLTKKFSLQLEKSKKISDAASPETLNLKRSNLLRKKVPDKTDMPGHDGSRSGKRSKLLISRQSSVQPKVVLKSFLYSAFASVKSPLQKEKQKEKEDLGEEMDRTEQNLSQEAEMSLIKIECKQLLDSERDGDHQISPSQGERSLIRAQLLECGSPRDSLPQENWANQTECSITKQEEGQDKSYLPMSISEVENAFQPSTAPLEQKSIEILEDMKTSVCPLGCEEIKRSLENYIKATDILNSLSATVPSPSQIKIKYIKIMEDSNNSVCIPLICGKITQFECKEEIGADDNNNTMSRLCESMKKQPIEADNKNTIHLTEIETSEICGEITVDDNNATMPSVSESTKKMPIEADDENTVHLTEIETSEICGEITDDSNSVTMLSLPECIEKMPIVAGNENTVHSLKIECYREITVDGNNTTMFSLSEHTQKNSIVADDENSVPFPETQRSGESEVDSNLAKSDKYPNSTTEEIVPEIHDLEVVCEKSKIALETQKKTSFSVSCITPMPKSYSNAKTQVEDIKETMTSLVDKEIQTAPKSISKTRDTSSRLLTSPTYRRKNKRNLGFLPQKEISNLGYSSAAEQMPRGNNSIKSGSLLNIFTSFPTEVKKETLDRLEGVKKSICSPICDEIMKSLQAHITEAVSNSIDASTHSPHKVKKKSVEVVLDLKKTLLTLPVFEGSRKFCESPTKPSGVIDCRGASLSDSFQKKLVQSVQDEKNSMQPCPCAGYGEMQSSPETHQKIPSPKNWESDEKTEKPSQKDPFLGKEAPEQNLVCARKEIKVSTSPPWRKTALLKFGGTGVAEFLKSPLSSISILDRLTANEKNVLIFHLEKKRLELRQENIHTIVTKSYQKLPSLIKPYIPKEAHCDRRVFPRCRKLNFMPQEAIDSIEINLKHKYLVFLFGLPSNSQNSLKELSPKAVTPIQKTTFRKYKEKYFIQNLIVIKKEVKELLEFHISEKQKLGFSNSLISSLQNFIPSPPKNIYGPEVGKTVKRVICSLFIEGETRKSLPCHLRKMAAEQKCGIPSKLMKCESTTKELFPVNSMKALIVNKLNVTNYTNENIKQAVEFNMQLRLNQKSAFLPTQNNTTKSLPLVLQRLPAKDLRKLVICFLMKTLEIKMNMIPGVVVESIKMVDNQVPRKSRLETIHPNRVTKPRSTKLPFMEPEALHQITLNLQHKCLMFHLGLPVEKLPPKLTTSTHYVPRPKLNKKCKSVNEGGTKVCFSIDTEKLERHISFKKQNPYKIPPSIIKLLKSFIHSVCPSECSSVAMNDREILEKTLSLHYYSAVLDTQFCIQKDCAERSFHRSTGEKKPYDVLQIPPRLTKTVPVPPKDASTNTDRCMDSKVSSLPKEELIPELQESKSESTPAPIEAEDNFVIIQTNIDKELDFNASSLQKTENASDVSENHSERLTSSPEIGDIFDTKEKVKASIDGVVLTSTSGKKTEVNFKCQESGQKSVKLMISPLLHKKRVEAEMPFQTPNVICRTFKKSWENVPLSDGPSSRQDQKEMSFDMPFKLEDFSPSEKPSKTNRVGTKTKPVCHGKKVSPQSSQASGKPSSFLTATYSKTCPHKKKKPHPKTHSPVTSMPEGSSGAQSEPPSFPREEKLSKKIQNHINYPSASPFDSSTKVTFETNGGDIISLMENKDKKKPNLPKKNTRALDYDCDFTEIEKKQRKQGIKYYSGVKSPEQHFSTKPKSPFKRQQENDYFLSKRKNTQPFFYACTPADTPGYQSKTIRWNIPQNVCGQSMFRVPLVAKLSNPEKIWSSSKKFLELVAGPFNLCPVNQK